MITAKQVLESLSSFKEALSSMESELLRAIADKSDGGDGIDINFMDKSDKKIVQKLEKMGYVEVDDDMVTITLKGERQL